MDGRRDGPGHPRWSAPRPTAPSEKPVSSYASLACGPPPSYARQGSSGSWEYEDKPQRPTSPVGRSLGVPYYPSRGGRLGGRGRAARGGRERNDRLDRFSTSGQHRNSPDRFQSSLDRTSGYEAGEILPSQRLGSSPGIARGRLDDRSFEGRGGRSSDMESRSSGRFISRGGGRDAGRTGRGGPRSFGSGRFVAGRGGRGDFRGRRVVDGRDNNMYSGGKEWVSSSGRETPDDTGRVVGGAEKSHEGPRFFSSDTKNDTMHQRGDDRLSHHGRSYEGSSRDSLVNRATTRYSSLASNPDAPAPTRKLDLRHDDRFVKRRRDEDYSDFEDKRSRNNDYASRSRNVPNEEGRFPQSGSNHRGLDDDPANFDSRPSARLVDMRDRRSVDTRGTIDRQQIRSDVVMPPPLSNHDERRPRAVIDPPRQSDSRGRPGSLVEGQYDSDPSHRGIRRPGVPPQGTDARSDRIDSRPMAPPLRGEVSRRFVPAREESRVSGPASGLREEPHPAPPAPRLAVSRTDLSEKRDRDPRMTLDARPRDPRDVHGPGPPQRFDVREGGIPNDRGVERYGDLADRIVDNRPPMAASLDRSRDFREIDFRGRQTEVELDENRSRGAYSASTATTSTPHGDGGWTPHLQHALSHHNYEQPPHPSSRSNWNSTQGSSRSPIPSPSTIRGTITPSAIDQSISLADPGVGIEPISFAGRAPMPESRDLMGRGRGRGFRGMGRGRSDFSRFGSAGRGPTNYDHSPTGRDQAVQSRDSRNWIQGGDQEGEKMMAPELGTKIGNYASLAKQEMDLPSEAKPVTTPDPQRGAAGSEPRTANPVQPVSVKKEEKPRPISPPPKAEPSGVMKALVRLVDLEASMEYAYAKHMQLVRKQQELKAQAILLSDLPVGIEALKEDLEALEATESIYGIE